MKLQFTNGYRPQFDQISRILQYILAQGDCKKIPHEQLIATLGMPARQAKNLIGMMTGFGLVKPRVTTLTEFGKTLSQKDLYFEKLETLWMIHYIVSSNPEWVIWHRIINTVLPSQDRFEVDEVSARYFPDLVIQFSEATISEKLPKEVGAVFAAYTRSELSHLELLEAEETGGFVKSSPVPIPDLAFLFCLLYYRDRCSPGSSAMNVEDICRAEDSPGRVFDLPEHRVRALLENLHHAGLVRLEQLANLDQVRLSAALTRDGVLQRIYGG